MLEIFSDNLSKKGPVAQSVQRLATGWTVLGSNPGGGEIFRTCPDRPWDPPSLLHSGYRGFPGGKERPGRDADPSQPSSVVGHERVELYLYSPYEPYGLYRPSVPVQGCTLYDLTLSRKIIIVLVECLFKMWSSPPLSAVPLQPQIPILYLISFVGKCRMTVYCHTNVNNINLSLETA